MPAVSEALSEWGRIIARHDRTVLLSLLALGVPLDVAKEIAQAAWTRLYERRADLPSAQFPGLAIKQARFLALDHLRREQVKARCHDALARVKASTTRSPEERLLNEESLRLVLAELSRCSASEQRIFRVIYQNPDLTQKEIAEELGVSLGRVRQVSSQIRRRLRAVLREDESHD